MTKSLESVLNVTQEEAALLCEILDWAAERVPKREKLDGLKAKIQLAQLGPPWTEEWPTEPGQYWFWGRKFRSWSGERKPDLHLVRVRRCINSVAYVTDGHFMYEAGGAEGVWCPAILPEPPHNDGGK